MVLYTRYPIVARALGLAFKPSASREQRYLAYNRWVNFLGVFKVAGVAPRSNMAVENWNF